LSIIGASFLKRTSSKLMMKGQWLNYDAEVLMIEVNECESCPVRGIMSMSGLGIVGGGGPVMP
jgi:hypothetical protein